MTTYAQLKAQAEQLLKEAEEVRRVEVEKVITDIKQQMAEYDITVYDIQPELAVHKLRPRKTVKPPIIRFRGPNGQTWSGRGRIPDWLRQEMSQGKSKEEFAV